MNLACFIPWHLPACYICCGAPFRASRKRWSAPIPCWRLCTIPLAKAYGAPNFNTLLALHATNVEESTEILTIFPWYNYLLAVFIFALGVTAVRRRIVEPSRWGKMDTLGLLFSIGIFFLQPVQNLAWGGVSKVIDTGYPAFRLVKDDEGGE